MDTNVKYYSLSRGLDEVVPVEHPFHAKKQEKAKHTHKLSEKEEILSPLNGASHPRKRKKVEEEDVESKQDLSRLSAIETKVNRLLSASDNLESKLSQLTDFIYQSVASLKSQVESIPGSVVTAMGGTHELPVVQPSSVTVQPDEQPISIEKKEPEKEKRKGKEKEKKEKREKGEKDKGKHRREHVQVNEEEKIEEIDPQLLIKSKSNQYEYTRQLCPNIHFDTLMRYYGVSKGLEIKGKTRSYCLSKKQGRPLNVVSKEVDNMRLKKIEQERETWLDLPYTKINLTTMVKHYAEIRNIQVKSAVPKKTERQKLKPETNPKESKKQMPSLTEERIRLEKLTDRWKNILEQTKDLENRVDKLEKKKRK